MGPTKAPSNRGEGGQASCWPGSNVGNFSSFAIDGTSLVKQSSAERGSATSHPLVGREEELAMLMRRREAGRARRWALVLILGEPGLGKSRLSKSSTLAFARHRTLGWSGAAPGFSRTRRCLRLPNGGDNGSAALTHLLTSVSPIWRTP